MIWFSIEEKTPADGQSCAVMIDDIMICCEYEDELFYDLGADDIFSTDEVDFWCPLPEPPEVDFDDDDDEAESDEDGLHINNLPKFEDLEPEPIQVIFIKNSRVFNDGLAIFHFNMN